MHNPIDNFYIAMILLSAQDNQPLYWKYLDYDYFSYSWLDLQQRFEHYTLHLTVNSHYNMISKVQSWNYTFNIADLLEYI